jgi:hypothetical protein
MTRLEPRGKRHDFSRFSLGKAAFGPAPPAQVMSLLGRYAKKYEIDESEDE